MEDLLDVTRLLLATGGGAEQVAEQHRARREPVVADERHVSVVQVPGAGGDVEEVVPLARSGYSCAKPVIVRSAATPSVWLLVTDRYPAIGHGSLNRGRCAP